MRGRLAEVPRVARGHRDRHDPRARRGRRRGRRCRRRRTRTSTTTRSSRSTCRRTSIRSARSRRSTACSTSRATSCCRRADAYISIEMQLADSTVIPRPNPSEQLVLAWEYWDGKRWRHLGRTAPRGALPGAGDELGFHDETRRCRSPARSASAARRTWTRSRSTASRRRGSASASRRATTASRAATRSRTSKWVFKDDRPLRPPALRTITFRYREDYRDVRHVLAFNDFQFTDCTEVARTEYTIFQPFPAKPEESPALYLGFTAQAAERSARRSTSSSRRSSGSARCRPTRPRSRPPELDEVRDACAGCRGRAGSASCGSTGTAASWEPLAVDDETQGFTRSGLRDLRRARRLGDVGEVHRGALLAARAARAGRLRQAAARAA